MQQFRPLIALLENEPQFLTALARFLTTHGFDVVTFTRGEEFLAAWASRLSNCLLLDRRMPNPDCLSFWQLSLSLRHHSEI
jgi:FixJ family two-component response regulator